MKKGISISIAYLLVFFLINSCISKKEINKSSRSRGLQFDYNTNISYNNKNYQIQGKIKTNKRDILFINAYSKNLGVEIFRLLVINDSLWYLNRLQRDYFVGTFTNFSKLPVSSFNASLLNTIILGGRFDFSNLISNYTIDSLMDSNNKKAVIYSSNNSDFFLKRISNSTDFNSIEFGVHGFTNRILFNEYNSKYDLYNNVNISFFNGEMKFQTNLNFENFKGIKLNQLKFSIPKNYSSL